MIDLKNLGGGRKLIKKIIRQDTSSNTPWSQIELFKKLKGQKNNNFKNNKNEK
jgi:hypothetical protein